MITSILIMAPLAKKVQIVDTISILEYIPTPIVAAIKDRAEVTIDFEVSLTEIFKEPSTSLDFLDSAKNLSVKSIE